MTGLITPSRADPRTLVPAARAMYEQGRTRRQVLEAIYGVDLPREAALFLRDFARDAKPLQALWGVHPWELMIPLEAGGPTFAIGPIACERERRAYEQAPHVVLVACIHYHGAPLGGSLIGYDLDELRAGRSTVVGLENQDEMPASGARFEVFGASLVDVFCDVIASYRALLAKRESPDIAEELNETADQLASLEALR